MEIDGLAETEDVAEEEVELEAEEVVPDEKTEETKEQEEVETEKGAEKDEAEKDTMIETEEVNEKENTEPEGENKVINEEDPSEEAENVEETEIKPQKITKPLGSSTEERKSLSTINSDSTETSEALSVFKKRKTMELDPEHMLTDEELEGALEDFAENADPKELEELLISMNTNNIIRWDEAERILAEGERGIIKSGLPELSRPDEPENETDVDECIQKLEADDPSLNEVNLNNMKRTPIPKVQRLILAAKNNTHLNKLSLSNIGLTDTSSEPLLELLGSNCHLKSLCLDTNYLSGEFTAKLIEAATTQQTLEELRISNQSMAFSSTAEMGIMKAMQENKGICKLGLAIRSQEARTKVEQTMFRNCESRRMARKSTG